MILRILIAIGLCMVVLWLWDENTGPSLTNTSEALPYTVIEEKTYSVGRAGYTKIIRFVFVKPGSGNRVAYSQTAIKAALAGIDEHRADACIVYVFDSPASVEGGGCLALARYVPDGRNADGGKERFLAVLAVTTPMTRQELEHVAAYERQYSYSGKDDQALAAAARELGVGVEDIKAALRKYLVCERS